MKGISLPSFLQVVELERQTCSVEVKSQGKRGYLQFQGGVLVHALAGPAKGEDAAYDILAWDDPEVDVDTQPSAVEPSIDASVTALLLESSRRQDELGRDGHGASAEPAAVTSIAAPAAAAISAPPGNGSTQPAADALAPSAAPTAAAQPETMSAPAPAQPAAMTVPAAAAPAQGAAGGLLPDVRALTDTVQRAHTHLGDALLAIDVYALADGQPISGFNSQPRWAAYLAQMTGRLTETLANCGLPNAGSYYLIDLDAPQSLLVVPGRSLQWSVLFDASRAPLGLVLNVLLPDLRAALGET